MVLRRNQSVCKKRKRDGRTFRPIGFYPSFEAAVFLGALLAGAFASDAPADSFLGAAFFGAADFLAGAFSFFSAASCLAFAGAFALRAAGFLAGLAGSTGLAAPAPSTCSIMDMEALSPGRLPSLNILVYPPFLSLKSGATSVKSLWTAVLLRMKANALLLAARLPFLPSVIIFSA